MTSATVDEAFDAPHDRPTRWSDGDREAARKFAIDVTRWNHPEVRSLDPRARQAIGRSLANAVNAAYPRRDGISEEARIQSADLKQEGVARLGSLLTRAQCADVVDFLKARPCYNLHYEGHLRGDKVGRMFEGDAGQFPFGSYPRDDLLQAPHLIDALTSDRVLQVVEEYLGARPMLFSVNVYWSFNTNHPASYGQDFHRDISHPHFCVLFLYLTDTTPESGAHQYIRRTHRFDLVQALLQERRAAETAEQLFSLPMDGLGFTGLYEKLFGELIDTISGPAGSAVVEDTYGIHRGLPPINSPRLMAWARYSLFPTPPELDKSDRRIVGDRYPVDPRRQYALRGILD